MPGANELPPSLQVLTANKAIVTSEEDWQSDVRKLTREIDALLDSDLRFDKNRKLKPVLYVLASPFLWFFTPLITYVDTPVTQSGIQLGGTGLFLLLLLIAYGVFSLIDQFALSLGSVSLALAMTAYICIAAPGGTIFGDTSVGWGAIGLLIILIFAIRDSNRQRKRGRS